MKDGTERKKIKSKETNIKRGQNIEKSLSRYIREKGTHGKNNRKLVECGGKSYFALMHEMLRPVPIPCLDRVI